MQNKVLNWRQLQNRCVWVGGCVCGGVWVCVCVGWGGIMYSAWYLNREPWGKDEHPILPFNSRSHQECVFSVSLFSFFFLFCLFFIFLKNYLFISISGNQVHSLRKFSFSSYIYVSYLYALWFQSLTSYFIRILFFFHFCVACLSKKDTAIGITLSPIVVVCCCENGLTFGSYFHMLWWILTKVGS